MWQDYWKKFLEIRGKALMFKRGEGTKNGKVFLLRMKIKLMNILLEVSDM